MYMYMYIYIYIYTYIHICIPIHMYPIWEYDQTGILICGRSPTLDKPSWRWPRKEDGKHHAAELDAVQTSQPSEPIEVEDSEV